MKQQTPKLIRRLLRGSKQLLPTAMLAGLAAGLIPSNLQAGCVHDWNTVDYLEVDPRLTEGTVVHYTVTTDGDGSNKLTVKVEQQKVGGGWTTLDKIKIDAGQSGSGTFTVKNLFSGTTEEVRFRLSRDLGTKEICYDVYLSY